MSAPEPKVELVETKDLRMFIPVLQEVDFGDRFLLSMLHWCGFGRRSTPLDYWKVFLLRFRDDVVGVSGLYRQRGMAQTVYWVGRFAIRPGFRRQGFGKSAMYALIDFAKSIQIKELWVYTGSADDIAVSFRNSLGFELLGCAGEWAPGRTMDNFDIVPDEDGSAPAASFAPQETNIARVLTASIRTLS
jgi:GNAT superfamily N-acetyltransferase